MNDELKWFRYEPTDKSKQRMAGAWRNSARNMASISSLFSSFNLTAPNLDFSKGYDEWVLVGNKIRIYGTGNSKVDDPRIEFQSSDSDRSRINKLIDDLNL